MLGSMLTSLWGPFGDWIPIILIIAALTWYSRNFFTFWGAVGQIVFRIFGK